MDWIKLAILAASFGVCRIGAADTFGSGANFFAIDFVSIGNAGNAADMTGNPNPAGAVPYSYRIGKYEIPRDAIIKANAQSAAAGTPLGITQNSSSNVNHPSMSVTWNEVAHFVNWLNTSSGSVPAYKEVTIFNGFDEFENWLPTDAGYNASNRIRNSLAKYFIPSSDEWYKAAFYDPAHGTYFDYATGSNVVPTAIASGTNPSTAVYRQSIYAEVNKAGGLSPYGTMAQTGNVWEWLETEPSYPLGAGMRMARGGAYTTSTITNMSASYYATASPFQTITGGGFRIASKAVPEPSTLALFAFGCAAIGRRRQRR